MSANAVSLKHSSSTMNLQCENWKFIAYCSLKGGKQEENVVWETRALKENLCNVERGDMMAFSWNQQQQKTKDDSRLMIKIV